MTIDKAIEIKESPKYGTTWPTPPEEREADKLSNEALKRLKEDRKLYIGRAEILLPGETKE